MHLKKKMENLKIRNGDSSMATKNKVLGITSLFLKKSPLNF